jgi:hypothetical protein
MGSAMNPKLDAYSQLSAYNDWFVTGANCVVYLVSNAQDSKQNKVTRELSSVPVVGVGYSVQQQKTPLYGYNDTGPRKIMRGQRLVSGDFVILHKSAGYFEDILMSYAEMPYGSQEKLSLNEQQRLTYWNTRQWDSSMNDPQRAGMKNQKNIFYNHPNFDISIVYGAGDEVGAPAAYGNHNTEYPSMKLDKVKALTSAWYEDPFQPGMSYKAVNPLYRDNTLTKQRETIVGVQLVGKSKSISIDGEVIMESYSFLAIDVLNQ